MTDVRDSNAATATPATPRPAAPIGTRDLLLLAAWSGLASGMLEAAALPFRRSLMNRRLFFDQNTFWMIAVADLLYFTAAGLVLALVFRGLARWPRAASARTAMFVFAFAGFTSALFLFAPYVSRKPALVLAAGAAFQVSRVVAARFNSFRATMRRSLPWMAGAVVVLAIGVQGWRAAREWLILSRLPDARPDAPNVLLVVLDTVRAQSTSLGGSSRDTTPNLARFAREGVRFDRAIAPAPWTLPTHASIFTGRDAGELKTDFGAGLDDRFPTLAEILSANGYATAGFAANLQNCGRGTGLERGFAHYDDFTDIGVNPGSILDAPELFHYLLVGRFKREPWNRDRLTGRTWAPAVSSAFREWLPGRKGRPYFAFLNYFDAHDPYEPPPPYDQMFGVRRPKAVEIDYKTRGAHDAAEVAAYLAQYEGSIAYLDHEVGRLLDALRADGALENTLVIVTSDHGEEFAEHEVLGHGVSLYMPSLHVPLVVAMPGRAPAGGRVEEPVSLRDLGATILDVTGLADAGKGFRGASLSQLWSGPGGAAGEPVLSEVQTNTNLPDWWPVGAGSLASVAIDGYHYVRCDGDRPEELYLWREDPWEMRDLAKSPEHSAALERCRAALGLRLGR